MARYVDWFAGLLFLFNTTNSHRVGPHKSTHILWVLENRKERERERENKESKKTKKSCPFFETLVRSFSFRFILNFFFLLLLLLYYYKIIFPKSPDSLAFSLSVFLSLFLSGLLIFAAWHVLASTCFLNFPIAAQEWPRPLVRTLYFL